MYVVSVLWILVPNYSMITTLCVLVGQRTLLNPNQYLFLLLSKCQDFLAICPFCHNYAGKLRLMVDRTMAMNVHRKLLACVHLLSLIWILKYCCNTALNFKFATQLAYSRLCLIMIWDNTRCKSLNKRYLRKELSFFSCVYLWWTGE